MLDNVMTGRLTHMKAGFWHRHLATGKAEREEIENSAKAEKSLISLKSSTSARRRWAAAIRVEKAGGTGPRAGGGAEDVAAGRADGGHERRGKRGHVPLILDVNDEFGTTIALIEHDMGVVMDLSDRVVGDGLRADDRRRHPCRGTRQSGCDRRLSGGGP